MEKKPDARRPLAAGPRTANGEIQNFGDMAELVDATDLKSFKFEPF